ncbi:MAG: sugar nucleotide-binding protein [Candidatus Scalindua sp.]|nr:sugar nucleotide-binding protein [Candidatus Scalindua sp.]
MGRNFLLSYKSIYPDCVGTTRHPEDPNFLDLVNPDISSLQLSKKGYQEALILAAMPNIAICENEKNRTRKVNVDGTLSLIRQLVNLKIRPIFTSTDCVFDGIVGNYEDETSPNPIIEYGKQKAEIEKQIKVICGRNYLTIRLSKVFSLVKGDGSLLDEMANILTSGGTIQAAYNQVFCPTLVSDLISVVLKMQEKNLKGTFNVCSPESWSRYDLAIKLANVIKKDADNVKRISLDDLEESFKRPKNTTLSVENLQEAIDFDFTPVDKSIMNVGQNWK